MDTKKDFVPSYHDLVRPEIAALIPAEAGKILDLGCGAAGLGHYIKQRQKCVYHGIEINETASSIAKSRIDRVFNYDLEAHPRTNTGLDYDVLICADILEHLKNPQKTLAYLLGETRETATIIASLPNIAHPSVIADLSRGLFRYANAGILDRTHLRHFTLTSIFQMFSALNLKITKVIPSPSVNNPIQWLITAKKAPCYRQDNLATIIIPASSPRSCIKGAIDSIRKHTHANVRIIAINNALPTELTTWIEQQNDILEIRCSQNLGFTTAVNLGMEISNTPYTVICNDDILVTDNWLNRLRNCAESDTKIGIVGPITNRISGPQRDTTAAYSDEADLAAYASRVTQNTEYKHIPFHRIVFFCALLKKELIDKIGHLDEAFSPGNFEDDDYCLRSLNAGFKNIIDRSTFIHHYCSQTLSEDRQKWEAIMKRNHAYFLQKWGSIGSSFLNRSSQ